MRTPVASGAGAMLFDYRALALANQSVTAVRLTKDADEQ
jgi:hypothetical protein